MIGTPSLLRAARATYVRTVRQCLADDGLDDLPANGAAVLTGRRTSATAVREALGTTKQAASQLIDTLVLRGYLERVAHPSDRRRTDLDLTGRGEAAAEAVRRGVREVEHRVRHEVSAQDWATFRRVLELLGEPDPGAASPQVAVRLRRLEAVLPVADVGRASAHYAALGFTVEPYPGGGYAFARRGSAGLHLDEVPDVDAATNPGAVYLHVSDADVLAREWQDAGVGETRTPVDTAHRMREGAHRDPDGNLLRFGHPLLEPPG